AASPPASSPPSLHDALPICVLADDLRSRQPAVHQPDDGALAVGDQRDLDHAGAGRKRGAFALEAPAEDDPAVGDDLEILAAGGVATIELHPVHAAGPRVERRVLALPLRVLG